ncbi:MAG: polysaccharide ABC transporter ATP-binding protein [Cyclobacteriaceae bacterium]
MAPLIIEAKGLGKKYRLGAAEKKSDTIAGAILKGLKSPLENLRQIRGLSNLDREDETVFWALRDVSFSVQEGDVLGIIGHNGAGKSTLLKILSQITEPTTGEVRISGRVAALLEVGTGFHPELTGRENIYMNGTILGMTKKEIDLKLDAIIDFSGVEKYVDTPVKFYSSGMRVRLGFSVAAHLEPEILIIDEVLSVGDAEFQKKCLGKMEDVSKNGRTVLFVSHNMTAVQNLCHKGIVLKNGIVKFTGPIEEAVHAYLGEYSDQRMELHTNGQLEFENDHIRFISARILNQKPIETKDDIQLEFSFEYKGADTPVLDVTYHLFDEMNTLLFVGTSGYDLNVRPSQKKLTFQCTIPGSLLYEGNYKIGRLLFVRDKGFMLLNINDALAFDVISSGTGNFGWMGKKQGVIKPKLKWIV